MYDAETKAQRRLQDIKGLSRMLTQRLRKSKTTTTTTTASLLPSHPFGDALQLPVCLRGLGCLVMRLMPPRSHRAGFLLLLLAFIMKS